jgi:aldose 1-epimerase
MALCVGQTTAPDTRGVTREEWGKTADGIPVQRFTLRNSHGMVLRVMSLGATITSLEVPDKNGTLANLVLGADNLQRYLRGLPTAGPVQGRVANRIANATFDLDGQTYKLNANNGPHTLHGGRKGFAAVVWEAEGLNNSAPSVRFTYHSKDGEEGFPGNLTAVVTYSLTGKDEVVLDYTATSDKTTLVNLTNHAFFNLSGAGSGDILNHHLWVDADQYTVADATLIPTGEIAPVKGTPLDFTAGKEDPAAAFTIAARLPGLKPMNTYDHNFVLNPAPADEPFRLVARLFDPKSGRQMEVRTDQPGLQLYTGDNRHPGLCLETQHFPDAIHHASFPSIVLKPGDTFHSQTIYTFSAK